MTDTLVFVLFWLRVGLLGLFGLGLCWTGLQNARQDHFFMGIGIVFLGVASYFWRHPIKPSPFWFPLFAIAGMFLFGTGYFLGKQAL